ncbi:MAG: hypothetical protein NZ777_13315 [Pseudomonadales bacterium]|nr:hypothetical protein [Pseudomonadales bacterium]
MFASNVSAAYYDTRKVTGGVTEIHMNPPHIIPALANWKHAPITMEEGDGPIMDRPPYYLMKRSHDEEIK